MPADLIVIEIAAPKVSDSALSVLVSACSRAARDAECVLARNANDAQPAAVAIVTLQSEDKIRVEVGVRQGDHDSWRTKDFTFVPADESMDRWRAVGFAIGTLAESNPSADQESSERAGPASSTSARSSTTPAAASASSSASSSSSGSGTSSGAAPVAGSASSPAATPALTTTSLPPKPSLEIEERPVASDERRRKTQLFIGASVIFGPGLDRDPPWRVGSALSLDLAPARMPVFFTVGGSAATRLRSGVEGVKTRWFDVSLGGGAPLIGHLDESGLEFRVQALAEYFDAQASDGRVSQAMSRWTLGLQGSLGGRLQIVRNCAFTAEVQAAGFTGETDVLVAGSSVGSSASFRYLGSAGLRVQLR